MRTTFSRNGSYWDKIDSNVDEVIFTPIGNASTLVAALLSGEVDVIEPVPVQDVDRIKSSATLKVMQGPELRVIFLGMDQKRDELQFSSVKGKIRSKTSACGKRFIRRSTLMASSKT